MLYSTTEVDNEPAYRGLYTDTVTGGLSMYVIFNSAGFTV